MKQNEEIVYAHLIENPMDQEEMSKEKLLLMFELFTEENINAMYAVLHDGKDINTYCPERKTLSIYGEIDSEEFAESRKLLEKCQENNGWLKGCLNTVEGKTIFKPVDMSSDDSAFSRINSIGKGLGDCKIGPGDKASDSDKAEPDDLGGEDDIDVTPYTVKVFNAGHGNTITITKNDRCIVFDCGASKSYQCAIKKYFQDKVKPNVIIISHWHEDHYNMLCDIDYSNLELVIIPNRNISEISINNRLNFFNHIGVNVIDASVLTNRKNILKNYGFDRISLFVGEGKMDPGVGSPLGHIDYDRTLDDNGIILSVEDRLWEHYAILPGDCSYYSWPDEPELDLLKTERLVVPHHGGHAIIQNLANQTTLWTKTFVSTSSPNFTDSIDANSQTTQKTFVTRVLKVPKEHLTSRLPQRRLYHYFRM